MDTFYDEAPPSMRRPQPRVQAQNEPPPEGATSVSGPDPTTGKWLNTWQGTDTIMRPKFPFERTAYPDEEAATSAAARRAQIEYDAQWRTPDSVKRGALLLGILGGMK